MKPVFFTDRDLGKQFPEILRAAGLAVERHADHFAHDCPDEEWLREVGRREWIAVTHDRRIRYKPNELAAVIDHRVPLLVVVGSVPYPQLASSFVSTVPKIERFIQEHSPPYIAKIYRASAAEVVIDAAAPGRIELWFPKEVE